MIQFEEGIIHALPLPKESGGLTMLAASDVLRLDQVHPLVSGNKWYKLKYNLEAADEQGYRKLLSCGGPHSNHLHALAYAGKMLGFETTAFVRGYSHLPLTETLLDCRRMGMELIFIDKKTYLNRYDAFWCHQQAESYQSYWIPEGGNNDLGKKGCADIAEQCAGYDEVWMTIGSGCTFTGIAQALAPSIGLKGIMAIKGGQPLAESLLKDLDNRFSIDCDSHLGGFGRCPENLVDLINHYDTANLPLDPVYTAKLVMAFEAYWREGKLDANKRYLLIHSGGLQGRRGIESIKMKLQ